ncbi:hypothetical protein CDAR_618511 [Caerostris darwini]|uniref:Uncharacterized protein n=1 Tax=Caerostris darwini TaxID=1538125 RepID=A0AAV4SR74_9ARAC|nr:hypothetical protein CDAR_618511 [Caerostris darwini]
MQMRSCRGNNSLTPLRAEETSFSPRQDKRKGPNHWDSSGSIFSDSKQFGMYERLEKRNCRLKVSCLPWKICWVLKQFGIEFRLPLLRIKTLGYSKSDKKG